MMIPRMPAIAPQDSTLCQKVSILYLAVVFVRDFTYPLYSILHISSLSTLIVKPCSDSFPRVTFRLGPIICAEQSVLKRWERWIFESWIAIFFEIPYAVVRLVW